MAGQEKTLFTNPSLFSILTQDARTASMLGDPRLLQAVVTLQSRPEQYDNLLKADHRLSTVLEVLLDRAERTASVAAAHRPTEHLWQLIRNGSEEDVRKTVGALGQRPPVLRGPGPRGLTFLMEAAARRRKGEHLVSQLIGQGANVQERDAQGRTALHHAAMSGNVSAARALLEAGADASQADEGGAVPLELALSNAHDEVAVILIDAMERSVRRPAASNSSATPSAGNNNASHAFLVPHGTLPFTPGSSPSPSPAASPLVAHAEPKAAPRTASPISAANSSSSSTTTTTTTTMSPALTNTTSNATTTRTATAAAAASSSTGITAVVATATVSVSGAKSDDELVAQLVALEQRVQDLEARLAERDKRLAAMEEELLCSVCLERPINTVLLECGHTVLCLECSATLKKCPLCSKSVTRVVRTYRA